MLKRLNQDCNYFPCHSDLEDCTFCYCPYYPCEDEKLGTYVQSKKLDKELWSCKDCNWIHDQKVVGNIFELLRKNKAGLGEEDTKNNTLASKTDELGVIVLCHGSKLTEANESIMENVIWIRERLPMAKVEAAFLQLSPPALSEIVKKLVGSGCRKIVVVPFFLFNGNHVQRDIPAEIEAEKEKYSEVEFMYAKNIGKDERLYEVVLDRIKGVVDGN